MIEIEKNRILINSNELIFKDTILAAEIFDDALVIIFNTKDDQDLIICIAIESTKLYYGG